MSESDQASIAWIRELVAGEAGIVRRVLADVRRPVAAAGRQPDEPALQRRIGPDDIVQSVCRTFFRRSQDGQFELHGTASLWRLLCAITLAKVRHHARFHYQEQAEP